MDENSDSKIQIEVNFQTPRDIQYLNGNDEAFKLIESVRWESGRKCPRCDSSNNKYVKSDQLRDLIHCRNCKYLFNTISGTVFQGSKIRLARFLHFFVMSDSIGAKLNSRDILYVIEVTNRTAVSLKNRTRDIICKVPYFLIDHARHESIRRNRAERNGNPEYENFFNYCEANGILLNKALLKDRVREILSFKIEYKPKPKTKRNPKFLDD